MFKKIYELLGMHSLNFFPLPRYFCPLLMIGLTTRLLTLQKLLTLCAC